MLLDAARSGRAATVKLPLHLGVNIEAADVDKQTALQYVASEGYEATVRLLLDRSAEIASKSDKGFAALHYAASEGHEATVRLNCSSIVEPILQPRDTAD